MEDVLSFQPKRIVPSTEKITCKKQVVVKFDFASEYKCKFCCNTSVWFCFGKFQCNEFLKSQ